MAPAQTQAGRFISGCKAFDLIPLRPGCREREMVGPGPGRCWERGSPALSGSLSYCNALFIQWVGSLSTGQGKVFLCFSAIWHINLKVFTWTGLMAKNKEHIWKIRSFFPWTLRLKSREIPGWLPLTFPLRFSWKAWRIQLIAELIRCEFQADSYASLSIREL